MRAVISAALVLGTVVSACAQDNAQDKQQRQIRALPHLMNQIVAGSGSLAVCQGDVDDLRTQLDGVNKRLADATAQLEKLKASEPAK